MSKPTLLKRCWSEYPKLTGLITAGCFAAAIVTNPWFLWAANFITYKTAAPKSGFWLMSAVFATVGLCLLASRHWALAGKLLLSVTAVTFVLLSIDIYLRIKPPVEVTAESNWVRGKENSWGFKDHEPRPDAETRILVLGDSITFGWGDGLTTENRYHDLLETRLTEAGLDVDVQHTAVPTREMDYHLEMFDQFVPTYDPQLVILGFCFNDINYGRTAKTIAGNIEHGAEPELERFRDWVGYPFKKFKLNEWFLGTLLTKRATVLMKQWGWSAGDWIDDHNTQYHAFLQRMWTNKTMAANVRRDLARLRDECQAEGRQFLVVVFPYRFHCTGGDTAEIDTITGILDDLRIPYVDLYADYRDAQQQHEIYSFRDECHPTDEGHQIAADAVTPVVKQMLEITNDISSPRGLPPRNDD